MLRSPAMAAAISARLDRPLDEILALESGVAPVSSAAGLSGLEHDALLLLATLAGATPDTAPVSALALLGLRNEDARRPHQTVAAMLRELAMVNGKTEASVAFFNSTLTACRGDRLTILLALHCEDGDETIAYTDGSPFRPELDGSPSVAVTLPGRVAFRIAADVLGDDSPVYGGGAKVGGRPIGAWKHGVAAELARMPRNG